MKIYKFKVADYKRIAKSVFILSVIMIPVVLILFYLIRDYSRIPFLVTGILLIFTIVAIYLSFLKYFLVYDSEFVLDENGIKEKNLKNGKEFFFKWDDVSGFKTGAAKITGEDKEYLTISFKNTSHTISVSEFIHDEVKINNFYEFRDNIQSFLKQI